jgi:hypothetical protein
LVYKVKLKPKRFTIRVKDKDVSLSPWMAVTAEIKTGEKGGYNQWLTPSMRSCRFQLVNNVLEEACGLLRRGGERILFTLSFNKE